MHDVSWYNSAIGLLFRFSYWDGHLCLLWPKSFCTSYVVNYLYYAVHNTYILDTVTDFLIKLGIKPRMHLLEISIFFTKSYHRQTYKIMNNLKDFKKFMNWPKPVQISDVVSYSRSKVLRPKLAKLKQLWKVQKVIKKMSKTYS